MQKQTFAENLGTSGVGPPFEVSGSGEILFYGHWGKLLAK
jgi:hypothetical protein